LWRIAEEMKNKNKGTKFPVVNMILECYQLFLTRPGFKARIKKIMQKDEEVGKVAQATPVAICASIFARVKHVSSTN
jgi:Dr1-associated corepressor